MPSGDVTPQAVVEFMLAQKGLDRPALDEATGRTSRVPSSSPESESCRGGRDELEVQRVYVCRLEKETAG